MGGFPGSPSADFPVLVRWVACLIGVLGVGQVIADEGRLAAVTAMKCIVDADDLCPGIRGGGARIGDGWGMGSARRVRGGRWPVVTLMLVVLWA